MFNRIDVLTGTQGGTDLEAVAVHQALERCRQHVAVLDKDAGKWRLAESPLPDVKGDLGITAGLHVLGAGRAVIIDLLPHDRDDFRRQMGQLHPGFDPKSLEQTMRAAGFASMTGYGLPPEPGVKGPALFLAVGTATGAPAAGGGDGTP